MKKIAIIVVKLTLCPLVVLSFALLLLEFNRDLPIWLLCMLLEGVLLLAILMCLCMEKLKTCLWLGFYFACGILGFVAYFLILDQQYEAVKPVVRGVACEIRRYQTVHGVLPDRLSTVFGDNWVPEVDIGVFIKSYLDYSRHRDCFSLCFSLGWDEDVRYSSQDDSFVVIDARVPSVYPEKQ